MAQARIVVKGENLHFGSTILKGLRSDLSRYSEVRIEELRRAPKWASCPECGKGVKRHDVYPHEYFDIHLEYTLLRRAIVGVYECGCGRCFAHSLDEVPPRGRYSHRVRQKALECLVNDTMTLSQTRERLWRDYHLVVSTGTLHGWYVATGMAVDMSSYEEWTRQHFSGVVCIDEVYTHACAVLIASDPVNDCPIAYWIAEHPDHVTGEDVECLYGRLNQILPRQPDVVITDGSRLYSGSVEETWPEAHHQLCYFHVMWDICGEVLKGVREFKASLDSNAYAIQATLQTKYAAAAKKVGLDIESLPSDKALLTQRRYLFVKRQGEWSVVESLLLKAMARAYPTLGEYRRFMTQAQNILAKNVTKATARRRRRRWLRRESYQAFPHLVAAMSKMRDEVFEKLLPYLNHPGAPRTNNHIEGFNRVFRKINKTCYNRRRKQTIRVALNHLFIYRFRKHPLYDESYGAGYRVPERSTG